ncbi:MAG: glutamate ABC transporter substrate-binding protein [Chloroflexota bacterium]
MKQRVGLMYATLVAVAVSLLAQPVLGAPAVPAAAGGLSASVRAAQMMQFPDDSYMKAIQDRGVLRAGVKQDVLLFGYLNPRTNKIEGFDVDIAKELARVIFGDPEKVDLRGMPSAARIPSLQEGVVDIVVSTMTITKARLEQIDFADVYYESGQMILVPGNSAITGIQDTAGKRVCAAKGSTSETNITKFSPEAIVVQADVYSECLLAAQQGRADAISTDDVILLGLAEQDPSMKLLGPPFTQEPYGIGIAKGHPEFVELINATLTQLKESGRWSEIHKQWLGKFIETPAPPSRTAVDAAV